MTGLSIIASATGIASTLPAVGEDDGSSLDTGVVAAPEESEVGNPNEFEFCTGTSELPPVAADDEGILGCV